MSELILRLNDTITSSLKANDSLDVILMDKNNEEKKSTSIPSSHVHEATTIYLKRLKDSFIAVQQKHLSPNEFTSLEVLRIREMFTGNSFVQEPRYYPANEYKSRPHLLVYKFDNIFNRLPKSEIIRDRGSNIYDTFETIVQLFGTCQYYLWLIEMAESTSSSKSSLPPKQKLLLLHSLGFTATLTSNGYTHKQQSMILSELLDIEFGYVKTLLSQGHKSWATKSNVENLNKMFIDLAQLLAILKKYDH